MINLKLDWSQGSTQRAIIVLPFAVVALWLVINGDIQGGLTVLGMTQTVYHLLGIAISDTKKED